MALKARIREENGVDVVIAGPSENIKQEYPEDRVVPCSQEYAQDHDLLFPTYIGPQITVETMENGKQFVRMLYTPVESDIHSVKSRMVSEFDAIFNKIDARSTRSVRAIVHAQATGADPEAADVEVATACEEAAIENRERIAKINAAETLEWLHEHQSELRPHYPWEQDEMMMGMPMGYPGSPLV